jgi:YVTN family beta-propeller protein
MKISNAIFVSGLAIVLALPSGALAQSWGQPTSSSPIAISRDDTLVWVVNTADNSVSVIRPDIYQPLAKIGVGPNLKASPSPPMANTRT